MENIIRAIELMYFFAGTLSFTMVVYYIRKDLKQQENEQ
jgi:hypothetical protein